MKRFPMVAVLAAVTLAAPLLVSAAGAYGKFLPPDQAFQLSAHPRAHAVVLDWQITNGYYLYRKKFGIKATKGLISTAQFPPGEMENDPNFGHVEVYRREVRAEVPVKKIPPDGRVSLTVTYQGCANAGLCYPPITKLLTVQLNQKAAAGGSTASGGDTGNASTGPPQSTQG